MRALQRDVFRDVTVMAAYVGSRGVHNAMRTTDANGVIPSMTPDGLVWPCAGVVTDGVCSRPGGGARFNAAYGQIDGQVWNGSSSYHALLLSAKRRYAKGFDAQLSFTWSRSEDTGSSVGSGGPFLNSVSGQFLFAPLRALSDFHVGRTLVGSGTWEVPFGRTKPWGGWQVGGILNISDGLPFTPLISGDALGQANQSLFNVPDRLDQPGCDTAVNPGNPSQYIKLSCFAFPVPEHAVRKRRAEFTDWPGRCHRRCFVDQEHTGRRPWPGRAPSVARGAVQRREPRELCGTAGQQQTVRRDWRAGELRRPDHDALHQSAAAATRCQIDLVAAMFRQRYTDASTRTRILAGPYSRA